MFWQIGLIVSKFKTIIVTVPENCTGAELFEAIKNHADTPKAGRYHLMTADAGEIDDTPFKRLEDYDVANKGYIHLAVVMLGGVLPSVEDLQSTSRCLKSTGQLRTTTSENKPDVFDLDNDTTRAIMSCGHAVAPLSLAMHCFYELEKGEHRITCPDRDCGAVWKFKEIREAACLSDHERFEFERRMLLNKVNQEKKDIKECPECNVFSIRANSNDKRIVCLNCTERTGKTYEFCWICLRKWNGSGTEKCGNGDCGVDRDVYKLLAQCPLKELNGILCPSQRGCPECFTIIEHADQCKHMTCSGCKYEFCFICLERYPCGTGPFAPCTVASRQMLSTDLKMTEKCSRPVHIRFRLFEESVVLSVPENCLIEELLRRFYNHEKCPKTCGLRFISGGVQLENNNGRRLHDYNICNYSIIEVILRLTGG